MTAEPIETRELKACPFCGGEARLSLSQDESLWSHAIVTWSHITCEECDAEVPSQCDDASGEQSRELWNARATSDAEAYQDCICGNESTEPEDHARHCPLKPEPSDV